MKISQAFTLKRQLYVSVGLINRKKLTVRKVRTCDLYSSERIANGHIFCASWIDWNLFKYIKDERYSVINGEKLVLTKI